MCVLIFGTVIFNVGYFQERIVLYLVVGIQLVLNVFNTDWFYQGMEDYLYITQRSIVVKIVSVVAMFMFVRTKDDYIIYALIQSLAISGNNLINFIHSKKYVKFSLKKVDLKPHIKPIMILLSTTLAINIYTLLDTTMIGAMCGEVVVAYYSNVQKMIKLIATFTATLGGVMLPRLVAHYTEKNYGKVKELSELALKIIIIICVPVVIGLFLLAPEIVKILFGDSFLPCIITFRVFCTFILFTTVGNLYGTQLLMVIGKEKKLLESVMFGAIINFSLNLLLIRTFKQDGAAFASVVTECIVMIIQIIIVSKQIKIKVEKKFVFQCAAMALIMTVEIIILKHFSELPIVTLVFCTIIGGATYLSIGLLCKNEAIIFVFNRILNKFGVSIKNKRL